MYKFVNLNSKITFVWVLSLDRFFVLVWAVWLLGGDVCERGEVVVVFYFLKYIFGAVCDERLIHSGSMNNLL